MKPLQKKIDQRFDPQKNQETMLAPTHVTTVNSIALDFDSCCFSGFCDEFLLFQLCLVIFPSFFSTPKKSTGDLEPCKHHGVLIAPGALTLITWICTGQDFWWNHPPEVQAFGGGNLAAVEIYTLPKTTSSPLKIGRNPKGKDRRKC